MDFAPCDLLIGSPPCQAFSAAGKGDGHKDVPTILRCASELARGEDNRAAHAETLADVRSLLVVEPLRWALALRPSFVALEQVPPVLPLWEAFAEILRYVGYSVWTGVLSAETFGVPQTRKRAILMASSVGPASPPAPTHQAYVPGEPAVEQRTLEGVLHPWVSMAEALGWTSAGVDNTRGDRQTPGGNEFATDRPSWALTGTTRSWVVHTNCDQREDGSRQTRQVDEPAPAFTGKSGGQWHIRGDDVDRMIELHEAATLQGFSPDYPFSGARTRQFGQIGNAVPPPLAYAIVAALLASA